MLERKLEDVDDDFEPDIPKEKVIVGQGHCPLRVRGAQQDAKLLMQSHDQHPSLLRLVHCVIAVRGPTVCRAAQAAQAAQNNGILCGKETHQKW